MSTLTKNFSLIKPDVNDFYDIEDFHNKSMDILDKSIGYIYDTIIDNQTDFDAMIADETWLGAKNVLIVGDFIINSDITVPNIVKLNGSNCNISSFGENQYTINFTGNTSVETINFNNVNIYGAQLINNCNFTGDRCILLSSKNINKISVDTVYAKFDGCTNIKNSIINAGIENELEAMFYNCFMLINNRILFENKTGVNYTIYNECTYILKCFFQSGKVPLSSTVIPSNIKLYLNCSEIMDKEQEILWSGGTFMGDGTVITLSEKISEQKNGIVLATCLYENNQPTGKYIHYSFVPKNIVPNDGVSSANCTIINSTVNFALIGVKCLTVYDNKITGFASNTATGTNSGVTFKNNSWVLYRIIGV